MLFPTLTGLLTQHCKNGVVNTNLGDVHYLHHYHVVINVVGDHYNLRSY